MQDTIDSSNDPKHSNLFEGIKWWEKRRVWFNVFAGISGLIPLLSYASQLILGDWIGMIIYGVAANLCFSVGFLLEALDLYYLDNRLNLAQYRRTFFILGTAAVALVTILISWAYEGIINNGF